MAEPLDLHFVEEGVRLLISNCKEAHPTGPWDRIGKIEFIHDAQDLIQSIKRQEGSKASKYQLTISDAAYDEIQGEITLFYGDDVSTYTSTFAEGVEACIAGQPEEITEWARWYLLVGYLGLLTLVFIAPVELADSSSLNESDYSSSTFFSCGIHDNTSFFIGVKHGNTFTPLLEWN